MKISVDKDKAKEYFAGLEDIKIPPFKISIKVHDLLQDFIFKGGFDIEEPVE